MSTRKAPVHFFLCIFKLLPSLNFPEKRIFFLKRPGDLVGAFWLLEVTVQPTGLTNLKSEKPSHMEPSHIHWLTSHSSLDFSKGVTVGNLG
jgi:hypothetical protein